MEIGAAGRCLDLGATMMQRKQFARKQAVEGGFTLLETMIAIVIMTVGLLAVIASFATAIKATSSAQEDLVARHKALDALESIYTARNSQQLPFASINNTAAAAFSKRGAQPLLCAGADGHCRYGDESPATNPDTGRGLSVSSGMPGVAWPGWCSRARRTISRKAFQTSHAQSRSIRCCCLAGR